MLMSYILITSFQVSVLYVYYCLIISSYDVRALLS